MSFTPAIMSRRGHRHWRWWTSTSFHVVGYFEETKLPRIREGARVSVALMGSGEHFEGHVHSIASGIVDRERSQSPDLLANINPTFTWVRLAQRIPVRISLDHPPEDWQPSRIQEAALDRRMGDATAAVSDELVDALTLVGPVERVRERVQAYAEAGATSLLAMTKDPASIRGMGEVAT